ncbi:hypothetical protein SARC_03094 [Sphaeroforma arctica JP610]|uniref:Uncharacterized protein n=1 Tax=Sphaeroforma arctica JP610 TaxID=667725 RepID=A0A0L0G6Y9_9EUKA|nr:hypothetical protein SARC_03094 [Sphaeroforma arctica JP610]KNC84689.1 hypothetical protein SARC_03094 [Sphaeroforma arctica JP610]|eukprot:XP_014158591.1 hypothetical protein SARC_03094 [Sphaeroforma arctica JP610]
MLAKRLVKMEQFPPPWKFEGKKLFVLAWFDKWHNFFNSPAYRIRASQKDEDQYTVSGYASQVYLKQFTSVTGLCWIYSADYLNYGVGSGTVSQYGIRNPSLYVYNHDAIVLASRLQEVYDCMRTFITTFYGGLNGELLLDDLDKNDLPSAAVVSTTMLTANPGLKHPYAPMGEDSRYGGNFYYTGGKSVSGGNSDTRGGKSGAPVTGAARY